jgi:two-component system NarL family sensor kinase
VSVPPVPRTVAVERPFALGTTVGLQIARSPVIQFALSVLLALVLVGGASAYFFHRLSTKEAIRNARVVTETIAHTAIEPRLTPGLLDGRPGALAAFDRAVRHDVLGGDVVRVKLWRADGKIVYSDESRLIGTRFELGEAERRALRTGRVAANVSDLSEAENRYERSFGKLLQVYLPVQGPDGQPLLFELYQRYKGVSERGSRLWLTFLPILLAALAILAVVQLSLAWSYQRRLRAAQQERERLLVRAIQASNVERRHIAADLHDTVVQDLTGISLTLGAAAGDHGIAGEDPLQGLLRRTAESTRQCIRRLRSLLVDLYPPNLQAEGLPAALSDLMAPLSGQNIATTLDVPDSVQLSPAAEQLVFRGAQEALRNVAAHAHATAVSVRLSEDADAGTATLVVEDDGRGFEPADASPRPMDGHLGLALLADAAADLGGRVEVVSEPGRGTRVVVEVPSA